MSEPNGQDRTDFPRIPHIKKRAMLAGIVAADRGIAEAARLAGLSRRQTHYEWLKNDSEYAAAVQEAIKLSGDRMIQRVEERIAAWWCKDEDEYQKRVLARTRRGPA